MVVFNNPGYYHALDRTFSQEEFGPDPPLELADGTEWKTSLGPKELGTSANPFQNQVQALTAKIREGASRIELEFPGAGKGSSQAPTPESYGAVERRDMRELAKATGVETTTHATFQRQGFTGLGQHGFNDHERYQNLKEVKKAIQFAAEATTGGAVVFHTGEWQRPIIENWGEKKDKKHEDVAFRAFEEEEKRATFYMVDNRTGEFVSAIRKDKELFRPRYKTAADIEKENGKKLIGQYDELKGSAIEADDYVDVNGRWINEKDTSRLFERIPFWDQKNTKFEVERYNWDKIVEETERYNRKNNTNLRPEQMFVQIEVENQILQAKGHSLFYARQYEEAAKMAEKTRKALKFYESLEKSIPESEKWKLMAQRHYDEFIPPENENISEHLKRKLNYWQNELRHIHEASAAADAQAQDRENLLKEIKPIDEYGLQKSTEGIARAGIYAFEETERHKKDLKTPIYVAPENWQTEMYGGHPDELVKLVTGSREKMAQELVQMHGKSEEEAKKLAAQHIKSTIDIGHLNLWRQHMVMKPGESIEERDKRFNKWAIDKTKEMIKAGIVGHIHIADNMGWDDEHLTPGEGNAPIREFVKELEKAGFKDFIIEPGSFNPTVAMPKTWRHFGSPVYASAMQGSVPFGQVWHTHFGYTAPSNYIVGAYSPSNEWKLWSEVPLE